MGTRTGNQPPVMRHKDYPIEVATWAKEKTTDGGRQYMQYSFTLSRTRKDDKADGGYSRQSIDLWPEEILKAVAALQEAYRFAMIQADAPQRQSGGRGQR